jgi:hypothetical protein
VEIHHVTNRELAVHVILAPHGLVRPVSVSDTPVPISATRMIADPQDSAK